ncbi:hypothetical protein V1517DRAFT_324255 [Lipomyces orientalis]|uniref:Uncharacterized protein n=1 Tax=Lipomyces orientalis TaxID=1233043 RepID=A0ACC3TLW9_9ASCO
MAKPHHRYTIFQFPKSSPELPALARKYKAVRLSALRQTPEVYFSSYNIESVFSDIDWIERLTDPKVDVFICLAPNTTADDRVVEPLEAEWVGALTLKGPISREDFEALSKGPDTSAVHETRWQLYNLYTAPDHRGLGIASVLFRASMDRAHSYTETKFPVAVSENASVKRRVRVRGMVRENQTGLLKTYQRYGFVEVAKCSRVEVLSTIGDATLVPVEEVEKWHDKCNAVIELVVELPTRQVM